MIVFLVITNSQQIIQYQYSVFLITQNWQLYNIQSCHRLLFQDQHLMILCWLFWKQIPIKNILIKDLIKAFSKFNISFSIFLLVFLCQVLLERWVWVRLTFFCGQVKYLEAGDLQFWQAVTWSFDKKVAGVQATITCLHLKLDIFWVSCIICVLP